MYAGRINSLLYRCKIRILSSRSHLDRWGMKLDRMSRRIGVRLHSQDKYPCRWTQFICIRGIYRFLSRIQQDKFHIDLLACTFHNRCHTGYMCQWESPQRNQPYKYSYQFLSLLGSSLCMFHILLVPSNFHISSHRADKCLYHCKSHHHRRNCRLLD